MNVRRLAACILASAMAAPATAPAAAPTASIVFSFLDPATRAHLSETRARTAALRQALDDGIASGAADALGMQPPLTAPMTEPAEAVTRLSAAIARAERRVHVADGVRTRFTPSLLAAMLRPEQPQAIPAAIARAVAASPIAGTEPAGRRFGSLRHCSSHI